MMRKGQSRDSSISVINTKNLLIEVCEDPGKFITDIMINDALSSQSKLAALELSERKILRVSLNALKRAADNEFQRGFVELDELRMAARAELIKFASRTEKSNKSTKVNMKATINQLKDDLTCSKENCDVLTDAFYSSIQAADLVLKSPTIEEARVSWQKSLRELFGNLSLAARYRK